MQNKWRIVLGNDLALLADELGEELFSRTCAPFEKRVVVVPNGGFKDFLHAHFLKSFNIVAGVQILGLGQAVMEIAGGIPGKLSQKRIPSFPELSLAIEEQLRIVLQTQDFPSLLGYFSVEDVGRKQRRIASLSDELARLFARYGMYGKSFLPSWLKKQGWQQAVWHQVFSPDSPWAYPLEFLPRIQPDCVYTEHGKIALFGFSELSPAHLSFFSSLSATLYHSSACAHYWEDFSSDRERVFLGRALLKKGGKENVGEELNMYMQQGHPLLKNWGKLGREMLKSLDSFVLDEKEVYKEPQQKTILGRLQHSLLTLEEPCDLGTDHSIQIHSATSRLREVEILRDVLETLLQEALLQGERISLQEIVIASPSIALYAPYIHMVFGKSPFAYCITGLPLLSVSDAAQGFFDLLQLSEKKYAVGSVFKVMRSPSFMQRGGFSLHELSCLNRWFKEAKISEGLRSWEEGLDRLLYGLAMIPGGGLDIEMWPLGIIAQSEIDLFNRFLEFFSELKADLSSFYFEKSAREWFTLFVHMAERYFLIEWEKEPFFQELKALSLSCSPLRGTWTFESIFRIVSHLSQMQGGKMGSSLSDQMAFVPLSPGNIKPAKIVGCLGMDEEAFPRNSAASSLCEMHTDYFPAQGDVDRFLFLEMVLHTKAHLIFTYQRTHPEDGKHQGPSFLIEELDQYLKQKGGSSLKVDHPSFAFDPFYFSPESPVKKWSEADYLAAKACQSPPRPMPPFFNRTIEPPANAQEIIVDIRQLKKLARSPVQFYFNEVLKIYLKEEEDEEESAFLISNLRKSMLRKKALSSCLPEVLRQSEAQGALPRGLFQAAATDELEEEMEDLLKGLKGFDVPPSEIFSLHLSLFCREEAQNHRPPLTISLSGSRTVHIVGTLDELTPKGLLVHSSWDLKAQLKAWPLFLIYRCLNPEHPFLLLTKTGEKVDILLDDPHGALALYLDYFLLARQSPSPLMPEWAKAFLEGGEEEFAKVVSKEIEDPYVQYLKRRGELFDPEQTFSLWREPLKKMLFPLRGCDAL